MIYCFDHERINSYFYFYFFLALSHVAVKAQQLSGGVRPSIVVTRGYSVTTVVRSETSKDVQGSNLEADNSIRGILL